jgi:hypothetical protein
MQGNVAYIRSKVVGPFPGPCASGSYVHQTALFYYKDQQKYHFCHENSYYFFRRFYLLVVSCRAMLTLFY